MQQFFGARASHGDSVVDKVSDQAGRNVGLARRPQVRIAHGALFFFLLERSWAISYKKDKIPKRIRQKNVKFSRETGYKLYKHPVGLSSAAMVARQLKRSRHRSRGQKTVFWQRIKDALFLKYWVCSFAEYYTQRTLNCVELWNVLHMTSFQLRCRPPARAWSLAMRLKTRISTAPPKFQKQ